MKEYFSWFIVSVLVAIGTGCNAQTVGTGSDEFFIDKRGDTIFLVVLDESEWRNKLVDQAFHILREKGTERAVTGEYWDNKKEGLYACRGCGLTLFSSDTKYKSGTGWPSFFQPVDETHVSLKEDPSLGMMRIEAVCGRCGGHLGHVFDDGPPPTGKRYCLNSAALKFEPK